MSNAVFPSLIGLTYPVKKTPIWSTKIQPSTSGKETRLSFWSYPIYEFELSYDMLRSDNTNLELQQLVGFFNARRGAFDDWLFLDPDDNTATGAYIATGDGVTTSFQLARTYGGVSEPVRATASVSQVTKAGSVVASRDYSVNASTGVITFTTAPSAGQVLTWTGTFYWRCRFRDDQTTVEKFMANLWQNGSIAFRSIK